MIFYIKQCHFQKAPTGYLLRRKTHFERLSALILLKSNWYYTISYWLTKKQHLFFPNIIIEKRYASEFQYTRTHHVLVVWIQGFPGGSCSDSLSSTHLHHSRDASHQQLSDHWAECNSGFSLHKETMRSATEQRMNPLFYQGGHGAYPDCLN